MLKRIFHGLTVAAITIFCILTGAFTAFAANIAGNLDSVSVDAIRGWVADTNNPDQPAEVVLYLYTDGSTVGTEFARVKADQFSSNTADGNGNHAFSYPVDWNTISGSSFVVQAYAVSGSEQILLNGSAQYNKPAVHTSASDLAQGPGKNDSQPAVASVEESLTPVPAADDTTEAKGNYLGKFLTTAYCTCTRCTPGSGLTVSGTKPRANHTVSADLKKFPLGTKLKINGIVYTVEDTGVAGNHLDIYFSTHQKALNYGMKTVEVYSVD